MSTKARTTRLIDQLRATPLPANTITPPEAEALGLAGHFYNKPCPRGHVAWRIKRGCIECVALYLCDNTIGTRHE